MADKHEELIGVLFSSLEKRSRPCSVDELCMSEVGFHNKTKQVIDALEQMCGLDIVVKVREDGYILKEKLESLPDPRPVSSPASLDIDGGSHREVQASASGTYTSPLSREPLASSNHSALVMKAGNVDPLTDSFNNLQINHRNSCGQEVPQQCSMVQATAHSVASVDTSAAVKCTRQLNSIIQVLKTEGRPVLAKDVAQLTNIGKARSDVNRLLYFLEKKGLVCKIGAASWKFQQDVSEDDMKIFGGELAKIPDSKKNRNPPAAGQASHGQACPCPNAGGGCMHFHRHEYITHNNIQFGSGSQMNTVINQTSGDHSDDGDGDVLCSSLLSGL